MMDNLMEKRYALLKEYIEYMLQFDKHFVDSEEDIKNWFNDMHSLDRFNWVDIYDGDNIIGFLIVIKDTISTNWIDYFVYNAYVIPDYQGKGYMTNAIRNWMSDNAGTYAYEVYKQNTKADKFWKGIFGSYKPVSHENYENNGADINFYSYIVG